MIFHPRSQLFFKATGQDRDAQFFKCSKSLGWQSVGQGEEGICEALRKVLGRMAGLLAKNR